MPRKLYKQPLSFRTCLSSRVLCSLSLPISVHSALISGESECRTAPCLDLILKWVVLIEGTSRIGISGRREDLVRASYGLYNLLAGGSRTRLRNAKRGKTVGQTEVQASIQQAERGLETVRRVIEAYFVDDMCHLFETEPSGDLYEKVQHVDEDIALGREMIQSLIAASDRCAHTRHISIVPMLSFVMYVCEHIVKSVNKRALGEHRKDIWNIGQIQKYSVTFCRQVLQYCGGKDGYGYLPDYKADGNAYSVVPRLEKDDLSTCRIAHSVSVMIAVVDAVSSANLRMEVSESSMDIVENVCKDKDWDGSDVKMLKASIRRIVSAPLEKTSVTSSEAAALIKASTDLRDMTNPSLMPSFGIIGCSKYIQRRVRDKDYEEYGRPSRALHEAYSSIQSDMKTFSTFTEHGNDRSLGSLERSSLPSLNGAVQVSRNPGNPTENGTSPALPGFTHVLHFVDSCILLATGLAEECMELLKKEEICFFEEFKNDTIRMIILGCVGTDLEGFLTCLYEEYALKEIMSGFEEYSGARSTRSSKTAGRRERSPKDLDGRTRKARLMKAEQTQTTKNSADVGD